MGSGKKNMTAVLVPEAQTRAGVAAIRSLGRAGYQVHACSALPQALGLKSRFAAQAVLHPPYGTSAYLDWLENYIDRHDIRMIVPSANILAAIQTRFQDFRHLLPVHSDPEVLYKFYTKCALVKCYLEADPALGLHDHHPPSVIVDLTADDQFSLPEETDHGFFIKFEETLSSGAAQEKMAALHQAETAGDARRIIEAGKRVWGKALIQSGCTGRQVGVSLLMDRGEALAVSCVCDAYETPHSKGTMSLRKSCWREDIVADAIKRLRYLNWQGCAMVEYREAGDGDFQVIEINARYWQYLHLDIKSGVDFPKYQAEWFLTGARQFPRQPRLGIYARDTWPGEVAWLVNELRRDPGHALPKIKAFFRFLAGFFIYDDDFNFPGDRKLYLHNFLQYLKSELAPLRR